jgi:hypothetical protein
MAQMARFFIFNSVPVFVDERTISARIASRLIWLREAYA